MRYYKLSNIKLELTPIEESAEGQLLGGFSGIGGSKGITATNNGCKNNDCNNGTYTNNECENNGCKNNECMYDSNNGCENTKCVQITSSKYSNSIMGLLI